MGALRPEANQLSLSIAAEAAPTANIAMCAINARSNRATTGGGVGATSVAIPDTLVPANPQDTVT